MSSAYLSLLIFLPAILIPACASSSTAFLMMDSAAAAAAAAAKSLQLCLTLCDPIDGSPPGPAVSGILQARTLEWVAISLSKRKSARKWTVKAKSLSRVQLLATPWTAAYQAPPSMGFSRQEYWSGVPLPSPLTCWHSANKTLFANKVIVTGFKVRTSCLLGGHNLTYKLYHISQVANIA